MKPDGGEREVQGVRVEAGRGVQLEGELRQPPGAEGLVLFAHGSGSSRHSPRNRQVASALERAGLATLLFDLLSDEEAERDARMGKLRFDIGLLGERVIGAVDWARGQPELEALSLGLFGASTGAAAALVAAARRPEAVRAVVSRGGRPDLAMEVLDEVRAPTLLVVGGRDETVLEMNRAAAARLRADSILQVIPGATHLFEEPGAQEEVATLASSWFVRHLVGRPLRVGAPPEAPRLHRNAQDGALRRPS